MRLRGDVFASGEPLPDSVVLWTRLAPDPTYRVGGMPDQRAEGADPFDSAGGDFASRRAAAYEAGWEHQPARQPAPINGTHTLHRSVRVGDLAEFFLIDMRQFADEPEYYLEGRQCALFEPRGVSRLFDEHELRAGDGMVDLSVPSR